MATVLESMKQVGLAASLKKCAAGWRELVFGEASQDQKTASKVVRFLGLAGYYCWFMPVFAELTDS